MAPKDPPKGILDFVKEKRQAHCAICSLSPEIREQLRIARDKDINRATVREFLLSVHGKDIPMSEFLSHQSGHHE